MRVFFDNATPRNLTRYLGSRHTVTEARELGWGAIENGELLRKAEDAGFDVIVTPDKNIRYQQNLSNRKIAIVFLGQGQWPLIKPHTAEIVEAVNSATPGSFIEVTIPLPR
jgi:hypothetical protein